MTHNNRQVSFDDELLIVVDDEDNVIEYRDKASCHENNGILHRAFSIFIFNEKNEVLMQKRSEQKQLWPLFWTNSCCSHPRKGEVMARAVKRRLMEELGVRVPLKHLFTFQYHAKYRNVGSERELCSVFFGRTSDTIKTNSREIEEWKYMGVKELTEHISVNPEIYSPWFKIEWKRILEDHREEIGISNMV